ncbi:MAG TPA: N-acetyltransferase [Aliiroseovarius sp.]|nr:N-acetyltransferase [Aliiroseovarius sp.]
MYSLKQESQADFWEVEALFDLCFAPGREALSSYRLRDGVAPCRRLCLVARDADGILAGAIRYWPVAIVPSAAPGDSPREPGHPVRAASSGPWVPALLLGPIAVHPTRQGEGLGGVLIRDSLALARDLPEGGNRVLLVGDAPYYGRFGFSRLHGVVMPPPTNPARVLGHALRPDAWNGVAGVVCPAKPAGVT